MYICTKDHPSEQGEVFNLAQVLLDAGTHWKVDVESSDVVSKSPSDTFAFENLHQIKSFFLSSHSVITTEKTNILLRYLHQQWDKKVK